MKNFFLVLISITLFLPVFSQTKPADTTAPAIKNWYEKIALRGYAQVRYNRLFETNPELKCEQCDKSWGENGGFFIRRARLVFFGNVHERVYIYIQPDLASTPVSSSWHYAQLRDAYFDLALDKKKEFRFRIGQSKVPFGFENLQSSQNRLALDRNDGLNSAVANERDLGVIFYWAPQHIRQRFSELNRRGLKGSGDYGVFGFGLLNGQTANRPDENSSPHIFTRLTWPFKLNNGQILETSVQAYQGNFVVNRSQQGKQTEFFERRVAGSFIYYPQPFGLQAEFNIGHGPEFNPETMEVETQNLMGGYVQSMYYISAGEQLIIPFVKWQYYDGGKKHEIDARSYEVNDLEIGVEWQPFRAFELVAIYTISDRRFEDFMNPENHQAGRLLRLQAQVNF